MPSVQLEVKLLQYTPEPEALVAAAARNCYSPHGALELAQCASTRDNTAFVRGVLASGHLSVMEHVQYTFGIEGVSRTLLAQITRHRIASFSVQSQRYVSARDLESFSYVLPPKIYALGEEAVHVFDNQMRTIQLWYNQWQDQLGVDSNEDARFVLPGAAATSIVMTMNARELLHFLSLRMCNRAQWEICALAWRIYALCLPTAPVLFENAGPACVHTVCPEGKRSCGRNLEVRTRIAQRKEEIL